MNKRIRELAADAGYPDYMTYGQDKVLEKFAELIVKECIEINKQELAFNAFERLLNRYQEHFGVEE